MQTHNVYKISGVSVYFPCKPYPSQFSMMDKIIKGIERRQNCLLESPTGSGKSLALLCSSLAWQAAEKEKKDLEEEAEAQKAQCTCKCHEEGFSGSNEGEIKADQNTEDKVQDVATKPDETKIGPVTSDFGDFISMEDDDDDFRTENKETNSRKSRSHISIEYEDSAGPASKTESGHGKTGTDSKEKEKVKVKCQLCSCDDTEKEKIKIPKIYFGTRTHKQVAQIIRELKRTAYHDTKMTILGSREHTCIHPQVSRMKNKNDGCKELINGPGCHFKDCTTRLCSQKIVKEIGLATAWDLEDLVNVCKKKRACPYFLSRGLKEESDLIICPYNYLIDPIVREAMMIKLKGHVVILDEAHNIEDSAREAASQSIGQDSIEKAIKDLESLMEANICLADHSKLRSMLKSLDRFIEDNKDKLEQKDFDKSYKVWNGFHIVAQLEALGLGPKHFQSFTSAMNSVKSEAEARREEAMNAGINPETVQMTPATGTVLEQVFQTMEYLYKNDLKYVDDYRASLVQSTSYVPNAQEGTWLNARSRNGGRNMIPVETFTLNFWCMNPGVAFSDFAETRSVILTSGTLSPMNSFQSELGMEFKIMLEASHVIKDSQVWVGALGQGPGGSSLQAVYRNLETFAFQDELGHLVLQVCMTVPHGVLCFLPSYKVLEKLHSRWESIGLLRKISRKKRVICEPRGSDKVDFEDQMKLFYDVVTNKDYVDGNEDSEVDGAIFFAVCRGKVSEGLDFADNFARAVITVGIPYPNFKDVQVDLKKKYNDQHRLSRGLLSGHDWYEIQAFRALNQALGRCIRHRNDWGALIIVDDRFVKTPAKYCKGLSKWVRSKVKFFPDFMCAKDSLSQFTKTCEETFKPDNLESTQLSASNSEKTPRKPLHDVNLTPATVDLTADTPPKEIKQNFSIFNCSTSLNSNSPGTPSSKLADRIKANRNKALSRSSSKSTQKVLGSTRPSNIPSCIQTNTHVSFIPTEPLTQDSSTPSLMPTLLVPSKNQSASLQHNDSDKNENKLGAPSGDNASKLSTTESNKTWLSSDNTEHGSMSSRSNCSTGKGLNSSVLFKPLICVPGQYAIHQSKSGAEPASDKIQLRVITERAPVGKRFHVIEIPHTLHAVFGGNLNLPVSTTERLVYLVDEPSKTGCNPTARLIKMSDEEKDQILSQKLSHIDSAERSSGDEHVKKTMNHSHKVSALPSHYHKAQLPTAMVKPLQSEDSINNSLADTNSASTHTSEDVISRPATLQQQPFSVGGSHLNNSSVEISESALAMETSEPAQSKHQMADSLSSDSSVLTNTSLSKLANEATNLSNSHTHGASHTKTADKCADSSFANLGEDDFKPSYSSGTYKIVKPRNIFKSPTRQIEHSKTSVSPSLFETDSNLNDSKTVLVTATPSPKEKQRSIFSKRRQDKIVNSASKPAPTNIRVASTKSIFSTPVIDSEESDSQEDLTPVKRKVKGKKRKSRSASKAASGKKSKTEREGNFQIQTTTANDSHLVCFKCVVCQQSLITKTNETDFQEQKSAPPFLRDSTPEKQLTKSHGCFFFSTNPGKGSLETMEDNSLGLNTKYIEQEEICVQFLYCCGCMKSSQSTEPVGAQVQLAAGSGARFSKGQMWLFAFQVVKEQE